MHPSTPLGNHIPPPSLAFQHLKLTLQCSLFLHARHDFARPTRSQLRSLWIETDPWTGNEEDGTLQLSGLTALTALDSLHLEGICVRFGYEKGGWGGAPHLQPAIANSGLPPSLASLWLDGYSDWRTPIQEYIPPQASFDLVERLHVDCASIWSSCHVTWLQCSPVPHPGSQVLTVFDSHSAQPPGAQLQCQQITTLTNLRSLSLSEVPHGADLGCLSAMSSLTLLDLGRTT